VISVKYGISFRNKDWLVEICHHYIERLLKVTSPPCCGSCSNTTDTVITQKYFTQVCVKTAFYDCRTHHITEATIHDVHLSKESETTLWLPTGMRTFIPYCLPTRTPSTPELRYRGKPTLCGHMKTLQTDWSDRATPLWASTALCSHMHTDTLVLNSCLKLSHTPYKINHNVAYCVHDASCSVFMI